MSDRRIQIFDALLRTNMEFFLRQAMATLNPGKSLEMNWHIKKLIYELERVRRGEITRLIINMPPRSLKSIVASVVLPAFWLGHDPTSKIICVSYSAELAEKHARDTRLLMESPWYRRAFAGTRIIRAVDSDLFTSSHGFRRATSTNGTLTGLGGDLIIIDDPIKAGDAMSDARRESANEWSRSTLLTRLDDKVKGAIILVMQRVHQHDLTGDLVQRAPNWTVVTLPAIAEEDAYIQIGEEEYYFRRKGELLHPQREPQHVLDELRRNLGPYFFSAQYQQSPVPAGGGIIKRDWLRYYDQAPEARYPNRVIQSWDTAAKDGAHNDYSVCTTWLRCGDHYYLLDVLRGRFEYPALRDAAVNLAKRFKPNFILIEDASTGTALAQEIKRAGISAVRLIKPERDKETRAYIQQAKFEGGLVLFPREASYLTELESELLMFPQGRHDDIVDSVIQALAFKIGYDSTMQWVG